MTNKPDVTLDELLNRAVPWERNFREQMAHMREARNFTQTELARRLSVWGLPFHQQTVQRIESGQRPIRLNEALLIARELGVSLQSMMATSTPSARTMMYAVGEMRRGAEHFASEIADSMSEWADSSAGLSLAVSEQLRNYDESNDNSVLRYGFKWANLSFEAYTHLTEGLQRLLEIEAGQELPTRYSIDEFERMDMWWDQYDSLLAGSDAYPKAPEGDDNAPET